MPYMISLAEIVKQLDLAYTDILLVLPHFEEVLELSHHQLQLQETTQILKAHDGPVDVRSTLIWSTLHGAEHHSEEL